MDFNTFNTEKYCLHNEFVPNQTWPGPCVWTNTFGSLQNFGTVLLGPLHNLGPGPVQILFRSWFGTNIPSKHFGSAQRRINIYFRQS